MSDKAPPSLNLIERMAQRMAKQGSAAPHGNGAEAPVQSPLNGGANLEPRFVAKDPVITPDVVRSAPVLSSAPETIRRVPAAPSAPAPEAPRPAASAPVSEVRAPTPPKAPAPEAVRPTPGAERSRAVSLDFRVLRQLGMITPDNMSSAISNEFRGIKRKLLQKARDPNTRAAVNNLIMVTSSLPGEGKTFTSMNLAVSLAAERGLQVLLVDGDVVRPSVANMFKATPRDGLTDLLSGKVSRVSDIMCRCAEIPNLSVIFSGTVNVNSPELISSGRMADLCVDLSTRYPDRIIVIDTPPVLASAEPATLAAYAHQLIMVVAADQTERFRVEKALEAVASCKSISLLFNKAPKWNEADYTPYYGYANTAPAAQASSP